MKAFRPAVRPLAAAVALLGAVPVYAMQFSLPNDIKLNVDTTVSYGIAIRAADRDSALIGIANGGTSRSVNEDDGNLNFEKGKAFANVIKATTDVELKWRNFGFFGRGTAFYDFDLHDSDKLGPIGRERLGKDIVGLDGFVFASFDPAGKTVRLRAGRQVISWGESTFIPNGINVINPVDLSKLRIPGSELKEGLIPTTGLWASMELSKAAAVEGFYLTNWDKTRLDPRGSYFSNNDSVSDDADRAIVTFGRRRDTVHFPLTNPINPATPGVGAFAAGLFGQSPCPIAGLTPGAGGCFDPAAAVWAPRADDRNPSDNGQYGVAFRYLAHGLNNTELSFYFMNYHSRVPLFSSQTGSPSTSTATLRSVLTGGPLNAVHNGTAFYFAEYPEDIRLYGVSFNTQGPAGVALQGEYSYRPNQPIQLSTAELILATLGLPNTITGFTPIPGLPPGATGAALVPARTYLPGFRRLKMSQAQVTATKSWPTVMGAQQLVLVGEVGANYFHAFPTELKFNGPGAYLPATQFGATLAAGGSRQEEGFVTRFSWGYRLAARIEYANALMGGALAPRVAFAHDVKGVGPNFNEKVQSLSGGISWDYQRRWLVDLQYTGFFGGRVYCGTDVSGVPPTQPASFCSAANPLKDRDFYSLSVSYSF
ncbi:MAG: DUF1302 domain-containing protein [Burkholderiales bacterium]|nr:DUF1302 domain-containing protein [Burkholderiales bacterium]